MHKSPQGHGEPSLSESRSPIDELKARAMAPESRAQQEAVGETHDASRQAAEDWWRTSIIDMQPGVIRYRGYAIEELIGRVRFSEMVWLMLRGELPNSGQADLLDAALVAAVDHGPQAPSIAVARMAVSCGLDLNNAMASAVNLLGDVHGGAGEQAVELYRQIDQAVSSGESLLECIEAVLKGYEAAREFVPGFGHRFHPVDPRAPRLLQQVEAAAAAGLVSGRFARVARSIEHALQERKGKAIPMNIDGATAVIYAELGFDAPLARGLFCLSRSVGVLAHAWEQKQRAERNKGPLPKGYRWTYEGPRARPVPGA